jgi:hypothetical protein
VYTDSISYNVFTRDPSTPVGIDNVNEYELDCTNQENGLNCRPVGVPDFARLCLTNSGSSGGLLVLGKSCTGFRQVSSNFLLVPAPPLDS